MKKGLLSILAGALLVVGCQNYDDQFDALETQINALASTVAGLSQVQSDLASLAGTVNSLQSALSAEIDTALADGLSDIDAAVAELEAATADVASAEDVANIQTGIDANSASLEELLAQSAVFQGSVVINSKATLDVFHKMGEQLAIVNGSVDIDATADMDATKLQETVDFIKTTVGSFDYRAASSSVATVTFLNLTGTQTLTINQPGDYRFDNLSSATNVFLYDQFKSKIKIIHFGGLTSVSKFHTDTASSNLIDFNKVQELHLTKLAYYPPNNLTIRIDEGSVLASALDDVDADGDQSNITLSIEGPANYTASNFKDGSLTFKNVGTVTVNGFEGAFTLQAGVENFNADKVTTLSIGAATDLANLNITGALDPDVTTDKTGPAITIEDNANIETVTLAGKVDDVILEGNGNLTSVTISAEVDGKINIGDDAATADGNSDLTSVTLTGAKATSLEIANNSDLETVTVDVAFWAGTTANAKLDGELIVVDNTSLTSLNVSSDKIEKLTVTGNDDLATVDFSGLAAFGATGKPVVNIWDNDLEGSMNDTSDGDTDKGNGKSGDLGSVSSASGIKTLKTYLTAVAGDADSTAKVLMDTVDFTNEAGTTTEYTYATSADAASEYLRVLYLTPNSGAAAKTGTKQRRAWVIGTWSDVDTFYIWTNGTNIAPGGIDVDANPTLTVSNILAAANVSRATAAGVTLGASVTGNASTSLTIKSATDSTSGEMYAGTTNTSISSATVLSFTVGSITVTTTTSSGKIISDANDIADLLKAAYEAITNTREEVTLTLSTDTDATAVIDIVSKDIGSDGTGVNVGLSVSTSGHSDTATHGTGKIGFNIGATRLPSDNSTVGQDVVITVEDNDTSALLNSIGAVSANLTSATVIFQGEVNLTTVMSATNSDQSGANRELTSRLLTVSSTAPSNAETTHPTESRGDVRIAEDGVAAGPDNSVTYSRVGWL